VTSNYSKKDFDHGLVSLLVSNLGYKIFIEINESFDTCSAEFPSFVACK